MPFATMTLLLSARFASSLDSQKEGDRIKGGKKFVLGTSPAQSSRASTGGMRLLPHQQMEILANILREPGCSGRIIGSDFNPISPEDDDLIDKNELVDAWVAFLGRADPGGATWDIGVERWDGLGPRRLDKVAMMSLKAKEMEVLRPGPIEVPRPSEKPVKIPWSDHCRLRCTFTI